MNKRNPPPHRAGGFIIAMSILIGAGIGVAAGQPTIGILAGGAFGILVSLLLWLLDRRAS